jgi:hypothetical protein
MKTLIPFAVLPLALAAGCQSIKSAPEGSPRVEVELIVKVDDAVYDPFAEEVNRDELRGLVEDAVMPLADVGLRFYPVPSSAYHGDDKKPEYALTIEIQRFEAVLSHNMVEKEGQAPYIETTLDQGNATASAVFERRRENAPPLLVGREQATGDAQVKADETGDLLLRHEGQTGEKILLPHTSFTAAIKEAVEKALGQLQKPIDREFNVPAAEPHPHPQA